VATASPETGLRAPALLGRQETADHAEIWLEELRDELGGEWPPSRFGLAAREIARWDARMRRTGLPAGFDTEDAWAERHGQPDGLDEALARLDGYRRAPEAAALMTAMADPDFRATEALIATTDTRIARLARFEQTPLHHDLVRSNLFALADGGTAAIDWESVGRGPLGVDLASLVIGSVRRGEASAEDLPEIESVVLDGYCAEVGGGQSRRVREAYRLALGLRWHVVLGVIGTWLDPGAWRVRGSRPSEPREESLRHLLPLARHILAAGPA
jgi:hypothetical protein